MRDYLLDIHHSVAGLLGFKICLHCLFRAHLVDRPSVYDDASEVDLVEADRRAADLLLRVHGALFNTRRLPLLTTRLVRNMVEV